MNHFRETKVKALLVEKGVENAEEISTAIMELYKREMEMSSKEKSKERGKEWYAKNRERKLAYNKAWAQSHKENISEINRRQRGKNKIKAIKVE